MIASHRGSADAIEPVDGRGDREREEHRRSAISPITSRIR